MSGPLARPHGVPTPAGMPLYAAASAVTAGSGDGWSSARPHRTLRLTDIRGGAAGTARPMTHQEVP